MGWEFTVLKPPVKEVFLVCKLLTWIWMESMQNTIWLIMQTHQPHACTHCMQGKYPKTNQICILLFIYGHNNNNNNFFSIWHKLVFLQQQNGRERAKQHNFDYTNCLCVCVCLCILVSRKWLNDWVSEEVGQQRESATTYANEKMRTRNPPYVLCNVFVIHID
jgi:hypothetical protein